MKSGKIITIDGREYPVDKIVSMGMNLRRDDKPGFDIDLGDFGHSIRCRNANTVGCLLGNIGTFIYSTYYTNMSVKSIYNPDKSHVVEFIVETWYA